MTLSCILKSCLILGRRKSFWGILFDRLLVDRAVFHKELKSYIKCIVLYVSHKGNKGPLIFDEPCRQVSEKYKEGVGMFLKDIANGYNIQIIIITHIATYINCADQALNVYLKGTVSQVEEININ